MTDKLFWFEKVMDTMNWANFYFGEMVVGELGFGRIESIPPRVFDTSNFDNNRFDTSDSRLINSSTFISSTNIIKSKVRVTTEWFDRKKTSANQITTGSNGFNHLSTSILNLFYWFIFANCSVISKTQLYMYNFKSFIGAKELKCQSKNKWFQCILIKLFFDHVPIMCSLIEIMR